MTLTPSQIRYILVLMGETELGSLIRPNNWFTGGDVLKLRDMLKLEMETANEA